MFYSLSSTTFSIGSSSNSVWKYELHLNLALKFSLTQKTLFIGKIQNSHFQPFSPKKLIEGNVANLMTYNFYNLGFA